MALEEISLRGRAIRSGTAEGKALVSAQPIGFLGGVDPETGIVIEPGHPLEGRSVTGKVLIFPSGKGSTVGSYTLYRMSRAGTAPAAIINRESEAIVAVGAIISNYPNGGSDRHCRDQDRRSGEPGRRVRHSATMSERSVLQT